MNKPSTYVVDPYFLTYLSYKIAYQGETKY
jgi:hypothetical protein